MLLYYITDRTQFPGGEPERRRRLLQKIVEAARAGVDYVQLREKDLSARELESLAREAVQVVRVNRKPGTENGERRTGLLINSRSDVALVCRADGVHLRSDDISPSDVRLVWKRRGAGAPARVVIGVSCHSVQDVRRAASQGADFAVLAPVFEKHNAPGFHTAGLEGLRRACREKIPVFALGGITMATAPVCLEAGAAGIAGIRLFQENDMLHVVHTLRELSPRARS